MRRSPILPLIAALGFVSCAPARPRPETAPTAPLVSSRVEAPDPAPLVAAPEAPAPRPCGPEVSAVDALFTPRNRWRFLRLAGWHSATQASYVDETVAAARTVGSTRVAELTLAYAGWPDVHAPPPRRSEHRPTRVLRVQRDAELFRVECADGALEDLDEAAIHDAIRRCGQVEVPSGAFVSEPSCVGLACAGFEHVGDLDAQASLWPGVGVALSARSWYSAETGDGGGTQRFLVDFDLTNAAGSLGALGPEPAALTTAREAVHAAAASGTPSALAAHLHDDLHFSLNVEHRSQTLALGAWAGDDGAALSALAAVTASACATLGEVAICPAEEAARVEAIAGRCRASAVSAPRAVFVRSPRGSWALAAFLAGGVDDHWVQPEWAPGHPLPWSLRERFVPPGR